MRRALVVCVLTLEVGAIALEAGYLLGLVIAR